MRPRDEIEEVLQDVLGQMQGSPQDLISPLFGEHHDLAMEAIKAVTEWTHTLIDAQTEQMGYRTVQERKGFRRVAIPTNAFIAGCLVGARLRDIQIAANN